MSVPNLFYSLIFAFLLTTSASGVSVSTGINFYALAFLRVFIGFAFLWLWFVIKKKNVFLPRGEAWRPWLAGLLIMGIPLFVFYWAGAVVPAWFINIYISTMAFWAFIFAAFMIKGKDAFTWRKAFGVLIALGGNIAFIYSYTLHMDALSVLFAFLPLLICGISMAFGYVLNKKILERGVSVEQSVFNQYLFATIFLLFSFLLGGGGLPGKEILQAKIIIPLLYTAIFCSAIGLLLAVRLIKDIGVIKTCSLIYMLPVFVFIVDLLGGTLPHSFKAVWIICGVIAIIMVEFDKTNGTQN